MNNFLKSWWYFSVIFLITLAGWLNYYAIEKSYIYGFSNFFLFFHLFLVSFLLFYFYKIKKKFTLLIILFYFFGNVIYLVNFINLNTTIQSVIRNNQFSLDLLGKIRNLNRGKSYENKLLIENIEINKDFNGKILIKAEKFPNIFILKKENNKTQIFNVFDFKEVKNTNRLPFQLKNNNDKWELVYFDYNNISKVLLDDNFKFVEEIWNLKHNLSFHHWGDSFKGKLFIPGSTSKAFPVDSKFNLGMNDKCKNELLYFETIEIIDEKSGKHLNTISILDKISDLKKEFTKNSEIINCKDPLHLNDIRIIKSTKVANFFPNGKVGDIALSLLSIEAVVLLDKDTYEMKWFTIGDLEAQHSPRVLDNGKMLIFNNKAGSRVYGKSQIISIDIKNKNIAGIYKAKNKKDFFQSNNAGRIQILNNSIFINESQNSKLFKLECDDLSILLNCKRKDIFNIKMGNVYTHTLDIIE